MVGRNITVISKQSYDHVRIEYGEIVNASVIPNSDGSIDDFWNVYKSQKVPDKNVANLQREEFLNMKKTR